MGEARETLTNKARYSKRGGKIYDADVEISPEEAKRTMERNDERMKQNEDNVRRAGDSELGSVMRKAADLAKRKMSKENDELRSTLQSD